MENKRRIRKERDRRIPSGTKTIWDFLTPRDRDSLNSELAELARLVPVVPSDPEKYGAQGYAAQFVPNGGVGMVRVYKPNQPSSLYLHELIHVADRGGKYSNAMNTKTSAEKYGAGFNDYWGEDAGVSSLAGFLQPGLLTGDASKVKDPTALLKARDYAIGLAKPEQLALALTGAKKYEVPQAGYYFRDTSHEMERVKEKERRIPSGANLPSSNSRPSFRERGVI